MVDSVQPLLQLVRPFIYHLTILGVSLLQVSGLVRFYYIQEDEWKYSRLCLFHTLYCIFSDIPIFWALTKTRRTDPGHVLPTKSEVRKQMKSKGTNKDDQDDRCQKCGIVRKGKHIHHCSRCNSCTLEMDHHCDFSDSCIGKYNRRYFVQFLVWTIFTALSTVVQVLMMFQL